ncbi:hypothetical protein QL285_012804 [Trifolium repens]|nr:hypothetical protein QL285_012804 [Trifolium repens]
MLLQTRPVGQCAPRAGCKPLASCHASPCVSLNYVELFQHLFPPHHSQHNYSNGFNRLNSHSTLNFSTIVDGLMDGSFVYAYFGSLVCFSI